MMTYITNSRTSFAAFRVNARTNKRRGEGGRGNGEGEGAKDTNTDHSLNRCILLRSRERREGVPGVKALPAGNQRCMNAPIQVWVSFWGERRTRKVVAWLSSPCPAKSNQEICFQKLTRLA